MITHKILNNGHSVYSTDESVAGPVANIITNLGAVTLIMQDLYFSPIGQIWGPDGCDRYPITDWMTSQSEDFRTILALNPVTLVYDQDYKLVSRHHGVGGNALTEAIESTLRMVMLTFIDSDYPR